MEDDNKSKVKAPIDSDEDSTQPVIHTVSEGSDGNVEQTSGSSSKRPCMNIPCLAQYNGFMFPGVPPSPPKFVSVSQINEAASSLSNMALAHEIAVNNDFVLQKPVNESIEKQVKEVVHKAFWDIFEQKLNSSPPDYSHAIILLEEIKENLLHILLPQHTRLRTHINEVLDLELIQQKVENDCLDFSYYANFILSMMSRLCAPARDEKLQELTSISDIVPLYKGIFETLELMKLDMANFTIQQMRPHIQQQSVEYEKKKFQEFLNALSALCPPVDGLELTKKWLEGAYKKMIEKETSQGEAAPQKDVVIQAYLELLHWNDDNIFPETLQMDQVRFLSLRDQFKTIQLTTSVLLITYSIVGPSIQGISSFKVQLKEHLTVLLKDISNFRDEEALSNKLDGIALTVLQEVNECLVEHDYEPLDEARISQLQAQIRDTGSKRHAVRNLVDNRIMQFIEDILTLADVSRVKFPAGLSAFSQELSALAGQFLRLVKHNRAVFGDYYSEIVQNLKSNNTS